MDTETGTFKAKRSMVAMRKSIFGHCAGKEMKIRIHKYLSIKPGNGDS